MKRRGIIAVFLAISALCLGAMLLQGSAGDDAMNQGRAPANLSRLTNELSDLPELRRMDHVIDSFLDFWAIHGASLAIMRNDSLLYAKGYGKAGEKSVVTPSTTMRLASVSKLLTAAGIMVLCDEGKLFLENPVFGPFGILREYNDCIRDNNYYAITVEHLLRHQGGFSTRGGDVMFSTLNFMRSHSLSSPPDAETLVREELRSRLSFVPGTSQDYSNFGYLLLSLIIEKVSGQAYEDFMQEKVFHPAGCYSFRIGGNWPKDRQPGESCYYMQPDSEPVTSYDGLKAGVPKCYGGNDITGLKGAGAWIGTPAELARLVASIDGKPRVRDILSPGAVKKMTIWYDNQTFALGWIDCSLEGEWTRTGSFSGTSALVKVYPDGECWVMVTNTSAWRGSKFTRNINSLFKNLRRRFSDALPRRDLF